MIQFKRFRGKINIQNPRPPHFERAKYLALTKPIFVSPYKDKPLTELCSGPGSQWKKKTEENPFQVIIAGELKKWLFESRLVAFFHMNPMNADQQFDAYVLFKKQQMHYKNFGHKTVELAVKNTPYETILDFYVSHNMTVFCKEPNIKKLLQITKKFPQLILLAGIYEGKLLSKDELVHLSTIPNLESAQAGLVQTLNNVGGQLVSKLNSHQTNLVSQLQSRADQLQDENK